MKKIYFLVISLLFFLNPHLAQTISYSFDSDVEGWDNIASGEGTDVSVSSGELVLGSNVNAYGGIVSPVLSINRTEFHYVEFTMTNNSSITSFQLLTYLGTETVGSTAGKTNFTASIGTDTYKVLIPVSPNSNQKITRIGIRLNDSTNPPDGETLVFDSISIKSSISGFVVDPSFEHFNELDSWYLNNTTGVSITSNTDASHVTEGTKSIKVAYSGTSAQKVLFTNFIYTARDFLPGGIQVSLTYDAKCVGCTDGDDENIAPRWKVVDESNVTTTKFTGTNAISGTFSNLSKSSIIQTAGTNYKSIQLGFAFNNLDDGEEIYIDNIVATISTNWTGNSSTNWTDLGNWSNSTLPSGDVDINLYNDKSNYPTILDTENISIRNLHIAANASLTLNSGSSLIVNGDYSGSGSVTYNRNLGTANWYLVSCPVAGEDMTDMRTNNSFANGTGGSSRIGFAKYESDSWSYFTSSSSDVLVSGTGYSTKLASTGDISFTGTLNTTDVETPSLTTGFNLIGNPFTSYINSATFLGAATSSNLDQTQIWLWNQGSNGGSGMYEVKTAAGAEPWILPPGQGFFVKAISDGTVTFAESNQLNTGSTFQKTSKTDLKLLMNDGTNYRFFKIYYRDNASKGFDYGFEGETFGGIPNSLSVFTHLLEDNQGKNYQVQSLPNKDYETMVIPVGVIAAADKELTFTAEAMNLPADLKVFLEDRENGVITRLDEQNNNYKVALSEDLNGTGRFYLHTSNSALSAEDIALTGVRVFAPNKSTLRVSGINSANASVKIFSILGKKVLEKSFSSKGVSDINLPNLNTGVYIIQLNTEAGKLNKKIILE